MFYGGFFFGGGADIFCNLGFPNFSGSRCIQDLGMFCDLTWCSTHHHGQIDFIQGTTIPWLVGKKHHTHLQNYAVKSNWIISTKIGMKMYLKNMSNHHPNIYLLDLKKIQNRSSCRLVVLRFGGLVAEKCWKFFQCSCSTSKFPSPPEFQ